MGDAVKFTEAEYNNILMMANSSDNENQVIVQSIIEGTDIAANVVYIGMLYKEMDRNNREGVFTSEVCEKVNPHLQLKDGETYKNIDWESLVELARKADADSQSEGFVLNRFANEINNQLKEAGFGFMSSYKLNITKVNG